MEILEKIYAVQSKDGRVIHDTVTLTMRDTKERFVKDWFYGFSLTTIDVEHVWWIFKQNGYRIAEFNVQKPTEDVTAE